MASDVDDVGTDVAAATVAVCSLGWDGVQAGCDDDSGDVTNRHGVDCVDNVRTARQLDTALEHADEKVVVVAHTGGSVSKDIARSDDRSEEAASASLADELFRYLWSVRMCMLLEAKRGLWEGTYPFGLAVSGAETAAAAHQVICFHDSALSGAGLLLGQVDIVIRV
jgi:hypothetical protein